MKKLTLLLLSTALTFGAFAQKKKEESKTDTLDVSTAKFIRAGGKVYNVQYLAAPNLNVVYLNSPEDTKIIYILLKKAKQDLYSSADLDPITGILLKQIPQ
jgi:hypothetical protein